MKAITTSGSTPVSENMSNAKKKAKSHTAQGKMNLSKAVAPSFHINDYFGLYTLFMEVIVVNFVLDTLGLWLQMSTEQSNTAASSFIQEQRILRTES